MISPDIRIRQTTLSDGEAKPIFCLKRVESAQILIKKSPPIRARIDFHQEWNGGTVTLEKALPQSVELSNVEMTVLTRKFWAGVFPPQAIRAIITTARSSFKVGSTVHRIGRKLERMQVVEVRKSGGTITGYICEWQDPYSKKKKVLSEFLTPDAIESAS
jgi:hypothetical protein